MWVWHSINSHPFRSTSIGHPIPEIRLFQNLTLKIQGQGHGWGGHWNSQHGSNAISSHILLIPCQSAMPFLRYDFFKKIDLEYPRSRSWVRGKTKVTTWVKQSIDSRPFHSMSIGHPIPQIRLFQNLTFKNPSSRSWLTSKFESQKVGVASYRLTSLSFHVNRPSHSWDTAYSKFDLENPRSRSWVRWTLKVTPWVEHSIDSHPFNSMSISHPIPEIRLFQNVTLKIQGQGHGWGERWKSQSGCNILSIHIPFVPC